MWCALVFVLGLLGALRLCEEASRRDHPGAALYLLAGLLCVAAAALALAAAMLAAP